MNSRNMLTLTQGTHREHKERMGLCVVSGCTCLAERDKRRKKANLYCSKHRYAHQIERNTCRYAYRHKKSDAKRRGIFFDLTYEYFEEWCNKTGYLEHKGLEAGKYHIDRIKPELGYTAGNIQMLEHVANIKKAIIDDWLHRKHGSGGMVVTRQENYDECDWNDKPATDWDNIDLPF